MSLDDPPMRPSAEGGQRSEAAVAQPTRRGRTSNPGDAAHEAALLNALRAFVREEGQERAIPPPPSFTPRQVVALALLSADAVLLYLLPDADVYNERFVDFLKKVLPWVFGSVLVIYVNRFRQWLLRWSAEKRWVLWTAAAGFVLLLLPQLPVFSVPLRLIPANAAVTLDGKARVVRHSASGEWLLVPGLRTFPLVVVDTIESGLVRAETISVGPGTILGGTLLHRSLDVSVTYPVQLWWRADTAEVHVIGPFPRWFRRLGHQLSGDTLVWPLREDRVVDNPVLLLPPGPYRVVFRSRHGCATGTATVTRRAQNPVRFVKIPCV